MDTNGTLHAPVASIISLAADCAGYAVLCLCKDGKDGDSNVIGSRDGAGFATLFEMTSESHGLAADPEGLIWIAQGNIARRYYPTGAITSTCLSLPNASCFTPSTFTPSTFTAVQRINDSFFYIDSNTVKEALRVYDTKSRVISLLVKHVRPFNLFAVYTSGSTNCGKVLFISSSNSLCQLDLGSKEVKVLMVSFPHPSARFFSGPGPLAAMLVPDPSQPPATSSLYSYSEEGKLQLLRSGLTVAHNMLAVNKAGDVLFFQPHPDKKELLRLVRLRSALPPQPDLDDVKQ
ncbi:hypothetical protein QJQ45_012263 [Haematococcus lacustris]|nr:hypothetical protein QJQ45_012263 [Haematococcus lacustris]